MFGGGLSASPTPQPDTPPAAACTSEGVQGHTKDVNSLAWNALGEKLASGSEDRTARVWDVDAAGHARALLRLDPHQGSVSQTCWDPTAPTRLVTVASGERDKTVRFWDTRAKAPEREIKLQQEYINASWSGDGLQVAVGSSVGGLGKDDTAKDYVSIIDTRKYRVRKHKFGWEVNEFCFSPNSRFLLMTTELGTVELYNYRQPDSKIRSIQAHTDDCYCIAVDADHKHLAVGSKDSLVSLWQLDDMICLRSVGEHASPVRSISFSPCGRFLASGSYDAVLSISSVNTGRRLHAVDTHAGVNAVAWQPSSSHGRLVAFARETKNERSVGPRGEDLGFVRLLAVPRETYNQVEE